MANRFVGFAYYQRGEFAKAEEYLKKAAELRPMDPLPVLYLGMTSERQGAMSQAAAYYEEVLKRSPDSPIALNNLAYILAETTANARAAGRHRIQMSPTPWLGSTSRRIWLIAPC